MNDVRMLLVDDEPENAAFLRRVFRRGFDTVIAESGEEALAHLRAARFDVVITDYWMPGMTGIEMLERSLDVAPELVRVMVTANFEFEVAVDAVNRGRAHAFFHKPIDHRELVAAVDRLVADSRGVRGLRSRLARIERERDELARRLAELERSAAVM